MLELLLSALTSFLVGVVRDYVAAMRRDAALKELGRAEAAVEAQQAAARAEARGRSAAATAAAAPASDDDGFMRD